MPYQQLSRIIPKGPKQILFISSHPTQPRPKKRKEKFCLITSCKVSPYRPLWVRQKMTSYKLVLILELGQTWTIAWKQPLHSLTSWLIARIEILSFYLNLQNLMKRLSSNVVGLTSCNWVTATKSCRVTEWNTCSSSTRMKRNSLKLHDPLEEFDFFFFFFFLYLIIIPKRPRIWGNIFPFIWTFRILRTLKSIFN